MAIFGVLNGILNLETEAWSKGARKAGEDIDGVNKKTKSFLDTAKGFRSSGFGQSLRLLAGGGALGIVDRLVGDATKMVDKFSEMQGKIAAGEASFSDLAGDVARTTPVLGTFVKFWDSVLGAVTGATAEIAEQDRIVKEQLVALEKRNAIIRDGTEAEKGFTEELRKWSQTHLVDSMGGGVAGGIAKSLAANNDAAIKVQEDFARAMKKINEDIAKDDPSLKPILDKDPNADLLPALKKKMEDLKSEQKSAQQALQEASKPVQIQPGWFGEDTKAITAANSRFNDATLQIQNLQSVMNAATQQRDKLLSSGASVLNNQYRDLATGIGKSITAPLDAIWIKVQDTTGKVRDALDKNAAENRNRLRDLGKQLTEEALTPMGKFLEQMHKIDALQSLGQIATSTHDRLQKKYLEELESTAPKVAEYKPIAALESPFGFGKVNNQLTNNSPMSKLAELAKAQLEEQRKGLKLSPDTIRALKDGRLDFNQVVF